MSQFIKVLRTDFIALNILVKELKEEVAELRMALESVKRQKENNETHK